ncbi:HAD family hydrolase [Sphingomonas jatrophae]|uniref:Membrane protein n=1 Tax=Sphingomonas jatrophae TaxID=1166337 RepID=A0A1I6JI43_9SPHN|nr:HAD family hydrolase [Sphingomonas jatrophae]SFR78696.1 membrane protein [Sphingomonas jatrophae]
MSDALPRAILFDVDGTLVDSNRQHIEAWGRVFADAGFDIPPERIAPEIGKGGDQLVPTLLPTLGEEQQQALQTAHGELFKAQYLRGIAPLPGARTLLERAREAGMTVVLATSSGADQLDHYVGLLGSTLIDEATSSDDAGRSKPAPDIFSAALAKAGVPAAAARVVGDSRWDMVAAWKCGIVPVALLTGGFPAPVLVEAGAAAVYADPAALAAGFYASPLANAVSRKPSSADQD